MTDLFDDDDPGRLSQFVWRVTRPYRRLRWWWLIWAKQDLKNWLTRNVLRKPAPTRAERLAAIKAHKRAFENALFFGPSNRPMNTDWWKA